MTRPVDDVAYQAVKYRQREGWSHRDLMRLAHPATDDADRNLEEGFQVVHTTSGTCPRHLAESVIYPRCAALSLTSPSRLAGICNTQVSTALFITTPCG